MPDKAKLIQIEISERTGSVSALAIVPKKAIALLVLAHGAGAGMTHTFMEEVAAELAENGIATLRYNFPYMEKESRRPDPPAVAEKTVSVVMENAHKLYPKLPIFAGGKSFGGRMTSQRIAKACPDYLNGIVFFGFPLHAIGKPSMDRAVHLADVKVPMLFLQGTKDKLANISMIKKVTKELNDATLVSFENADHSFKVSKQHIVPDLVREAASWMRGLA
ncbi:MAG: dienelactone hydrolase family protein [Cyclobacteriaceae bacterium]